MHHKCSSKPFENCGIDRSDPSPGGSKDESWPRGDPPALSLALERGKAIAPVKWAASLTLAAPDPVCRRQPQPEGGLRSFPETLPAGRRLKLFEAAAATGLIRINLKALKAHRTTTPAPG